jgi:plastocyanin
MYRSLGVALLLFAVLLALVGCQPTTVAPAPAATPTTEIDATEEMTATAEPAPTEQITETEELTPGVEITPTEGVTGTEEITGTEGITEGGAVNTVEVELIAGEIRMPESISAGLTEFVVTNIDSELAHSFEIEGQGVEEEFEQDLEPGESNTLQVDLAPGEYTVYCPVDDHRQQGMELTLTVTE